MKLVDLDPRWLHAEGPNVIIGFAFNCPTRFSAEQQHRQSCFFAKVPRREQWRSMRAAYPELTGREWCFFQGCNPDEKWSADILDFERMSVTPSLDGSAGGNWHGHITGGEIIGGL